jgi:hypothetical protein
MYVLIYKIIFQFFMETPGYLRVEETNEYGDVQYMETVFYQEGCIMWQELDASKTWVIKNPSIKCIQAVSEHIVGCTVFTNPEWKDDFRRNNKKPLFLLSPKAKEVYEFEPRTCETCVITCTAWMKHLDAPLQTCFLMFNCDDSAFHNLTVKTSKEDEPGSKLLTAVQQQLGLIIQPNWLKKQGTVMIYNKTNRVLQTRRYIQTTVYNLNLRQHQVSQALEVLGLESCYPNMTSTGSIKLDKNKELLLLLHPDFQNVKLMKTKLNLLHYEMLLRFYNQTLGLLPFIKNIRIKPFRHYQNRELKCVQEEERKEM